MVVKKRRKRMNGGERNRIRLSEGLTLFETNTCAQTKTDLALMQEQSRRAIRVNVGEEVRMCDNH